MLAKFVLTKWRAFTVCCMNDNRVGCAAHFKERLSRHRHCAALPRTNVSSVVLVQQVEDKLARSSGAH
jgi:hypothetical protein